MSHLLKMVNIRVHLQGWIVHTLMHNTRALKTLNKTEFTGKKHQANTSLSHEFSSFFLIS